MRPSGDGDGDGGGAGDLTSRIHHRPSDHCSDGIASNCHPRLASEVQWSSGGGSTRLTGDKLANQ